MNFMSNRFKKYFAAVTTAFAAIAIPAQATDCTTVCQTAAQNAGQAAAQQAANDAVAECQRTAPWGVNMTQWMNGCMANKTPQINGVYSYTYQQTYYQCMGSCQ